MSEEHDEEAVDEIRTQTVLYLFQEFSGFSEFTTRVFDSFMVNYVPEEIKTPDVSRFFKGDHQEETEELKSFLAGDEKKPFGC